MQPNLNGEHFCTAAAAAASAQRSDQFVRSYSKAAAIAGTARASDAGTTQLLSSAATTAAAAAASELKVGFVVCVWSNNKLCSCALSLSNKTSGFRFQQQQLMMLGQFKRRANSFYALSFEHALAVRSELLEQAPISAQAAADSFGLQRILCTYKIS